MSSTGLDRWGATIFTDDPTAIGLFDAAVEQLVSLSGDPSVPAAAAAKRRLVLARVLQAYLALYSTGAEGFATARNLLSELDPSNLDAGERELLHVRAAQAWANGEWGEALGHLKRALLHDPRDLLALKVAQDLAFFLGSTRELQQLVGHVLQAWTPNRPGWGFVQGMYAFGLEENAHYDEAEQRARQALEDNARDVWAVHALAHVFEMEGRQRDGIDFLAGSLQNWSESYFAVHNWWHRALYHLELGETDQVLALYDGPIRASRSLEWLDIVDAAALLWRLALFGVDASDRAAQLAADIEPLLGDPVYAFNDWHAVMVAGLSERFEVCDERISVNRRLASGTNRRVVDWVGLDLLEGFAAFARGDHAGALGRLGDLRGRAHVVGGSHAQRDVIELTLIAAASGAGDSSLQRSLAAERVARKPSAAPAVQRLVAVHPPVNPRRSTGQQQDR
jgi:tetratricopeptide (TPR) repeat protein